MAPIPLRDVSKRKYLVVAAHVRQRQSIAVGFRNARPKAGVDTREVLYTARHTFGTYMLAASQNLPAVMKTMGHASVNSTLPYQHHGIEGGSGP